MADRTEDNGAGDRRSELAVNSRVRVFPDTDDERRGVVVEDFGEMTAQAVDIGTTISPTRPGGGRCSSMPAR